MPDPTWVDITALPASGQVGALLRYVIQTLTRRGLLADDRSRTNRELCRELTRREDATGESFCRFADIAEPFLYGHRMPGSTDLKKLQEAARRLAAVSPLAEQAAEKTA